MPRTRTVFTAGCFAAAALSQVSAQNPTQLCPPCAAVRQAQEIPKGLAPETLVHRDWAVAERGINEAGWQQSRGAGYRLGTGATILQIDTGVTHHPLLPDLTGADADDGRPGAPPRRGVDFHGADGFFGIGYSNEDPLLSGLLRFPGHGTKTSSVIAATWPPLQPAAPPSAALIAGTLADGIDVTVSYSYVYRDDVIATDALKKEGMESATVTVKPAGATRGIHVSVARSDDPLVATINVYAQDVNDPVRSLAASIPNTGNGPAGVDLTTKTWDGRVAAPAAAPWRLASAGAGERMRGAAPGARLIPLRGTQGVLLIPGQLGELDTEPWRIANALDQAALGDRGIFRRRIDVVSMSLGTWPETSDLCAAVERATKAGVIVIAAAGNQIRRTKYPAKCPTAIAVAGSNYQQRPWAGSAGSAEVTAAAPAEGVWTASVVGATSCTEASYGTSFATALVAAMAAEWVAYHREKGDVKDGDDKVGTVDTPGPFRAALKATTRPWNGSPKEVNDWTNRFGTGIADLTQLMAWKGNAPR